jgi:hypothetical protein
MTIGAAHRVHLPAHRARMRTAIAVTALLGTAVVVRGTPGILLAFVAFIVALDAVIPMPGRTWSEADDRFARMARERTQARALRRLRGLPPERLDVLDDRTGWASTAERRRIGVEQIPLASIAGTVEEIQARAFDRSFRPRRAARVRWKGVWMAYAHGAAMPPISVYRVDGSHFVRDGHHRVSVARDRGATTIEAEVVELRRMVAAA